MASLYKRKDSPYWWARMKEGDSWIAVSTGFRHDSVEQTRKARARCARNTASELEDAGQNDAEKWEAWVDQFLRAHCGEGQLLIHYRASWKWLVTYLAEKGIGRPRDLNVDSVIKYVTWRTEQGWKKSTALADIKVLRLLMRHAVNNQWASANPCLGLRIRRDAPKQKPELTDADIEAIYAGFDAEPKCAPWMKECFTIALHTGCRISETSIPMRCIDLARGTITFPEPKGGVAKAYTIPMPKALLPFFQRAIKEKRSLAVDLPAAYGQHFTKFFHNRLNRKDLTFHCTRVTRITRLLRGGVDERTAMALVNHSSVEVSRIYQRLRVGDFRHAVDKAQYPDIASATG